MNSRVAGSPRPILAGSDADRPPSPGRIERRPAREPGSSERVGHVRLDGAEEEDRIEPVRGGSDREIAAVERPVQRHGPREASQRWGGVPVPGACSAGEHGQAAALLSRDRRASPRPDLRSSGSRNRRTLPRALTTSTSGPGRGARSDTPRPGLLFPRHGFLRGPALLTSAGISSARARVRRGAPGCACPAPACRRTRPPSGPARRSSCPSPATRGRPPPRAGRR